MTAIPSAGAHGGDARFIARALGVDPETLLDLSASLNPVGPDVPALAAAHLDSLRRYPNSDDATAELARAIGVPVEGVLVTNGGAEAISLVANDMGGQVDEPEFSLHPRDGGPRWRSNPHNPTGRLAAPGDRAEVWDEAFYPLATGTWTRGDPAARAVVGSLTKLFSCPGLRLGYVLAPPATIDRLRMAQPEWPVNGLALALLPELLERAELSRWAGEIAALRRQLTELLASFGLGPIPSDANFVLCTSAEGLRERLAPHGVVVRDCASFGLTGHARVAVPDAPGLDRLAGALEASAP